MNALLLAGAGAANGLLAGLFFSFAVAISPGLRQLEDQQYVRTFRAVNNAILNPAFLLVFFAAPLTACGAVLTSLASGNHTALPWTAIGAGGSVVTFVVTAVVNVPLNNRLARATTTVEEMTAARRAFEPRWSKWNTVRALTSTTALVCFVLAGLATGHHLR